MRVESQRAADAAIHLAVVHGNEGLKMQRGGEEISLLRPSRNEAPL